MSIKPPADRDTLPDITLADVWKTLGAIKDELRAMNTSIDTLVGHGKVESRARGEHDARIARLERALLNGSEHPGPEAA